MYLGNGEIEFGVGVGVGVEVRIEMTPGECEAVQFPWYGLV